MWGKVLFLTWKNIWPPNKFRGYKKKNSRIEVEAKAKEQPRNYFSCGLRNSKMHFFHISELPCDKIVAKKSFNGVKSPKHRGFQLFSPVFVVKKIADTTKAVSLVILCLQWWKNEICGMENTTVLLKHLKMFECQIIWIGTFFPK